jgi:hypothetical protein
MGSSTFREFKAGGSLKSSEAFATRCGQSLPDSMDEKAFTCRIISAVELERYCFSRAPAKFRESFRPQLPLKKSKASHSSGFAPSVDDFLANGGKTHTTTKTSEI